MSRFIIRGRRKLAGTFVPGGNKNAALPMLAACLLTDETVTLHNVPKIQDVLVMLELLAHLGVAVSWNGRVLSLCAKNIKGRELDRDLCRRVRASILLAGPLVARHGRAVVPPPGGDVIGRRRLDTHFYGFRALGISVATTGAAYAFRRRELKGADLLLDEASVTATENILMAAVLAKGTTTMFNAACEPHVQNLCALLNQMGARIDGIGTNLLRIEGVEKLRGAEATVEPDYIEIGSFIAAAAATHGEISIEGAAQLSSLRIIERHFARLGVELQRNGDTLSIASQKSLRIEQDGGGAIPKIDDGSWPSFPSDLMSVAIVLATQARGGVLFFEKLFESRMYFVDRLIEMGAHIVQCDPHRVVVHGPSRLHGIHMSSPDIRAGMSMLIAALCAKGESVIDSAQVIDRGYERVDERLRALGADIERVD